ncbi:hypothetical protein GDO78_010137 [Eleutherodactylus coqui]|uniref:Usherin n=1 Tax=Eleutherodactylus coqui TaxID=57060 RepID=A0A8J6KAG8_ELECQ|nr:hypothetical protein GDO78_010137 [Eleutherodactylus coqui]
MYFFLLLPVFEALLFGLPMVIRAQGLFPELENIAAFKPIYTDPPDATCGVPKRSVFCQSDVNLRSLQTCIQRPCVQDCPYRAASPGFQELLKDDLGTCVRRDTADLRPRSSNASNSFIFYDHKDCFVGASPLRTGSSFTLTVWLKPEQGGEMCVMERSADGQMLFKLTISDKNTVFYYCTVNGLQPPIKVTTRGRFPAKEWIHLSVQVHHTKIAFFINGPEDDLTAFDARFLIDPIYEPAAGSFLRLGQSINGLDQFIGRMQDFRLYQEALTNREILEVFSEKFLEVPIQSECRCPSSHPRLYPLEGRTCLPNGVYNTTKDNVLRLNRDAHPASYMNDNDLQTTWISSILSASDFEKGLDITLDLTNGQYQIFYVIIQFYSPMPKVFKVQRRKNRTSFWEDWQYVARDCRDLGMRNNGFLAEPNSVNCLQLPRDTPYSNGNVTVSLLTPEPNPRPGYNDFYRNQALQEFVKASSVRIQLIGQYHTVDSNVSFRHRYYGIREITISGRCNCHGHANSCDTSVSPYKCLCDTESFTDGEKCHRCLPLYNNKPFRQGDHVDAYNCAPCRCNNHSSSCHYDASVDPYPDDHGRGGGGVCDDCLHNTAGQKCEVCKNSFYRKLKADPSAIDVCQPCDCDEAGTADKSQNCEELGGQCRCKLNVGSRRCDHCKDGFYNLQESNPDGCQPCECNASGTINGSHSCHRNTGQCQCKPHVIGPRCDGCKLGFKQAASGGEICARCSCSPYGAINQFCNPASGQCKCRENVGGPDCDTCIDNYYGLDADGCKPCECHGEGIIPGTRCDAVTGRCVCQPNVGGRRCNECLEGYYKFTGMGSTSCLPCRCHRSGAINASQPCDRLTGQCVCKASVTGQRCDTCSRRTYNLSSDNIRGCQDCDCDLRGTLPGSACDQITGQCQCLPNYQGRRCSRCKPAFHSSTGGDNTGCVPCVCHLRGSMNATCDDITGQCYCRDSSVSGLKCDQCRETFFGFELDIGRCQPCSCNPAGAVNTSCHASTGQCFCKELVSGINCSHCVEGSSSLDGRNPYGCSSTPSQQPPPRGHAASSTAIRLTWGPPDSPNTNRIDYVLYRDGRGIYHTTDYYPYNIQSYTDNALQPYTTYTYQVSARNVHGSVSSTNVTYQTRAGPPSGEIELSLVYPVGRYSASMNWTITPDVLGPVEAFRLTFTSQGSLETSIAYEGLDTQVTVHNLKPFTKYNFSVHACNSDGCLHSLPITVVTAQAPPTGQSPPMVYYSSCTELHLQWSPPLHPNGVVIRHELYMRELHHTMERRVFHASGWLNPQPVVESENENALMPPVNHAVITNLEPNTEYEFCIVTTNMAGSVTSEWVMAKTAESEPLFMPSPSVVPLSSSSVSVTWEKPGNNVARGDVTGYTVNMVSADEEETTDTTPKGIKPPLVESINSTAMKITWAAPLKPNGPPPFYQLERIEPSLTIQDKTTFIKGVRFPGHGYFRFSPSSLPVNTYFTGIKIQFRTKAAEGLILCAVSAGMQEEYIVLQISNGRPYFLFDPQDSAVAVTPTNDDNRLYNDSTWHQIIVTRNEASGTITVDGTYSGNTQIIQQSFVGCLGDIFIQKSDNPKEWELLSWDKAEERSNMYESWEGCPESVGEGAHFLGFGFLELPPSVFPGGTDIEISFTFITDQLRGLLLFIYNTDGPDYILVQLDHGNLTVKYKSHSSSLIQVNLWAGLSYCDGRWNHIQFKKEGEHFCVRFNNLMEQMVEPEALEIKVNSPVFVGGVPQSVQTLFSELHMQQGFGGCLKDISLTPGVVVNIVSVSSSAVRVSLDGCPSSDSSMNCRGNDSTIIYGGEETSAQDHSVRPFTEYLYRVIASNDGGSGTSSWSRGRSNAALAPSGQILLDVLHLSGSSVDVTWERPADIRGVIEQYILTAEPENNPNVSTSRAVILDTTQSNGRLAGLLPFTKYAVTLSVCTSSGCRGGSHVRHITTLQEGLAAFTEHRFLLSACTVAGCTNSSQVTLTTAQRPPKYVAPPVLRVLDSTRIHVQWDEPDIVNGILERYLLCISETLDNISPWTTIYNSTELFLDYTIQGLTPGTKYFIRLGACSGGGCAESDITEASTLESLPEGIGALNIRSYSPGSFHINWSKPQRPNGVITSYGLHMDGILMQNSSRLTYFVDGLAPWSKHSFRLQACTAKGCAAGEKVEAYTQESEPEGNVSVHVNISGPKDVELRWSGPERPNGRITYHVLFNGLFYEREGDDIRSVTNASRILYQSHNDWVLVDGLVPFSTYTITVNASNSKGHVTSTPIIITMLPAAPDGVLPPRLSSANPTSLQVVWSSPVRNNAPGLPNYRLQMRSTKPTNKITEEFSGLSASFTYTIKNLQPYTLYELRIVASNAYGDTYSRWTNVSTEQDKPEFVDPPRLSDVKSRSITITWQHPRKPNGMITHYNIYHNESLDVTVPGTTTSHTFQHLTPYTTYLYRLEGCTPAGCSLSKESLAIETLPDAPSDVLPPDLYSNSPTSVVISWKPPLHPNGLIEAFSIERRLKGTEPVEMIVTVPANHQRQHIDQSSAISPWKTYEYRMVVTTFNGGTNCSAWVEVTTRPSRPVGVQSPEVTILGPFTAKVTWSPPLRPNGNIISYEIRMPDPRILLTDPTVLSYIMTDLVPYTNYSVTIVACSDGGSYHGGCTESLPTYMTTQSAPPEGIRPPSAVPASDTFIAVSWQPPLRPNGPDIRYELLRRTILQPLTSNPPEDLNLWQNIYSGTRWFCEDKGLSRYTFYEYKLIVYNNVGYTSSPEVLVATLPGPPLRGSHLTVRAVNHTAIEASWTKPSIQDLQGDVDHYIIGLHSPRYDKLLTFHADVNQAVISGLVPNTDYSLYVEVSNGPHSISSGWEHVTTLDGEPEGLQPPEVELINSTAVRVIWSSPANPNGLVTEYSIYVNDKVYETDSATPYVCVVGGLAPYTVYSIQVKVCTTYSCIKSDATQVATVEGAPNKVPPPRIANVTSRSVEIHWFPPEDPNGIVLGYELRRRHELPCNARRMLSADKDGTFCIFITCKKGEDTCGEKCYSPQRQVTQCEVCCYDQTQNRISIADGDSCCGGDPYSTAGPQICCGASLHDGLTQRCCGGRIIPPDFICCGDEEEGSAYRRSLGMSCCGHDYLNVSETSCCSGPNGQFKAHLKLNNGIPLKCCESETITEEEECCNGIGYNPVTHVCSDRPSTGSFITETSCASAAVCPVALSDTAYCGQCHFNASSDSCFWTRGVMSNKSIAVDDNNICWTDEETVYIGGSDRYYYTDSGVNPFTTYEFRVATWNSVGYSVSNVSGVTTSQDKPQGLSPPRWTAAGNREGGISLIWQEPSKLNGAIYYVLVRDGVERYKGTETRFEDQGGIQPYEEYTYQLRACTVAGCSHSAKVTAAIKQGVPDLVSPPSIITVNSTALHLSWTTPRKPNGKIREYQIHQDGEGVIYVSSAGKKQHTVSGLQPDTKYLFFLTVCTSAGCNSSGMTSGYTAQAPPQGKDAGMNYFYQLEAQNEAGSNISRIYVVETPIGTPERIAAPYNITVLGPYSAFVAWEDPGRYDPGLPLDFNILLNAGRNGAQIHPAGEKRFIILEDLVPGAEFSLRVQACQRGSCGVSAPTTVVMAEAAPEGLDPPILTAIAPQAIRSTWKALKKPNGVITGYIIHRHLAGSREDITTDSLPAGVLEYTDNSEDLKPFTDYEYSVTAQNSEGSLQSSWSLVRTPEAAPEGLDPPTAEVTSPYSVRLTWTAPTRPHGIIGQYIIMYEEGTSDLTSATFSRSTLTVPGTAYQAKVFGLRPCSTYRIGIKAVNSAGAVASTWISIKTLEAAPSAMNFTVDKTEGGRALLLKWSQPARTNGALMMYNVYSDGNLEYSGLSEQFLLRRLEPYTVYTLVLEACTAAGCTQTFPLHIQTDEAPPVSQLPPQIKPLNATHIQLTWSPPVHPNGKILQYDIIKRSTLENALGDQKNMAESVVFRQLNTEPMVFTYTDGGLKPWTDYEYKVQAWNSVGYADSTWTVGQTSQAAPTFILPPKLFYDTQNPNHVIIQWAKPEEDNGKILYYKLQKNNITLPFNFDYTTLNYTDEDLLPYSEYTYSIVACTLGGCTISYPTQIRTLEGPPSAVNPPRAEALSATEFNVSWSPPSIQNGEITKYIIKIDNETYFAGTKLSIVISNLQPFATYNISLVACTSGGCMSSSNTLIRTKEAHPLYMKEPSFVVTSAQSIKISWQSPDKPNGKITNYELDRDGQPIYNGLDIQYHDFGLEPGTEYTYTIQASNSQGSCVSSPAKIKTHSSSPSGMKPPRLHAKSAQEILITWGAPLKANGLILNYTLHVHPSAETKDLQYTFNSSFSSPDDLSYLLKDLKPNTQYEARVEACTLFGCAMSEWVMGHTLEAPPESQPAPLIDVQKSSQAPLLAWNGPQQPNGKIIRYDVYRRRKNNHPEMLTTELVFNGSSLSFQDVDLLPFTEYEYQVWAVNSAGRTSSSWAHCRTGPAAPEGVPAPAFHKVSSTFVTANITPPTKPNGVVILYRLFSRNDNGEDSVVSEGTSIQQTLHGLQPFTNYSLGVEACTCLSCCSKGAVAQLTTLSASPSHQRPPHVTHKTSRAVSLRWSAPGSPNGIIQRYEVHMQVTCPPPSDRTVGASCTEGASEITYSGMEESCNITDLQPFTTYSLRVTCYNSQGSTSSDWVQCTTLKENPVYKTSFHVSSNITAIFLDWGLSFQLNGQLREFVLTERGQRLYSGLDSSVHIQKTTDKTPEQSNPSTKNGMETRGNVIYTELWFILLMALLALLLLAILLSLILQRKLTKQPYPRERPPLVPLQQRMYPASAYSESDTYTSDLVADVSGSSNRITLKSYIMHLEGISDVKIAEVETHTSHNTMVVRKTSQSQISRSFSENSLYRSASQLINPHDKKSIVDSSIWDSAIQGHDSGMFMDDEDLVSTIKSFSTVTKQHTAFTDTPL